MRWMKHLSLAHADRELAMILEEFGAEGYGVYWLILEHLAEEGADGWAFHALAEWANICFCPKPLFKQITAAFSAQGLINIEESAGGIRVAFPALRVRDDANRTSSSVWRALRAIVFGRDNFTCTYCGSRGGKLECDHIVPVARGGSSELENLTTACFGCNRSKRDKTVQEWCR